MAIMNVLSQMISLFMMMFVGFLAAKVRLIEPDFRRKLSSPPCSKAEVRQAPWSLRLA